MELDPKPWFCTSCSDRFVREQGIGSPTTHVTRFRPRPQYEQDLSKYPAHPGKKEQPDG